MKKKKVLARLQTIRTLEVIIEVDEDLDLDGMADSCMSIGIDLDEMEQHNNCEFTESLTFHDPEYAENDSQAKMDHMTFVDQLFVWE